MSMTLHDDYTVLDDSGVVKFKKAPRYNFQTSYTDYRKEVDNPEPWEIYSGVVRDFLYEINRAMIVDKYEWKIAFFGGFLRISKKEVKDAFGKFLRWWFYWKWDKSQNIMHWPKANAWSFSSVEGRCKRRIEGAEDIGEYGLWKHIESMNGNYDVMLKKRRKRPVNYKDFLDSL